MQKFIFDLIVISFYLMLPIYFANMAPVIVKKINFLKYPIDLGIKFNKKPIFGKNKTFRGLFFGVIFAIIVAFIQFLLFQDPAFQRISLFDYGNWLLVGFLMGLGALIGDLAESFFKRRANIKPGQRFIPFDQTDFVIGGLLFILPVVKLSWAIFITSILLSFLLHIIVNHAAYFLKIRKERW